MLRAKYFSTALSFTAIFDSGCLIWCGLVAWVGWKRTKSREAGMGGLKPWRGTTSGIKPENSFSALSPLAPTVGCFAPHSHPSPPEKKAASRRKSRLRRKKTAPVGWRGRLRG